MVIKLLSTIFELVFLNHPIKTFYLLDILFLLTDFLIRVQKLYSKVLLL
jgi:hypothetical protein